MYKTARGEFTANKPSRSVAMKAIFFILGFLLVLAGCGPAISTSLQQEAGPQVGFAELAAHPDRYQGRLELLGGLVMSVQPWEKGSLLTVDQRQLDHKLY